MHAAWLLAIGAAAVTLFVVFGRARARLRPPPASAADAASIFVAIPAFHTEGSDIVDTIVDLFTKAVAPGRVRVGLLVHTNDAEATNDALAGIPAMWAPSVTELVLPIKDATGPALARQQALRLMRNEDYMMAVDAHAAFARGWDAQLLSQLRSLPPKSLLSTVPPSRDAVDVGSASDVALLGTWPAWSSLTMPSARVYAKPPRAPVRSLAVAGALLFGPAALRDAVCAVRVERGTYLYGDLQLAVALHAAGWAFFAPCTAAVALRWGQPAPSPRCAPSAVAAAAAALDADGAFARFAKVDLKTMAPLDGGGALPDNATHDERLAILGRAAMVT